jgi:hypothetical protein
LHYSFLVALLFSLRIVTNLSGDVMGYSFWKVPAKILALNPKNKNSEPTTCHFHNIPFAARSEDWQSLITFSTISSEKSGPV